jgi:V8-like Glu-specific endopeptidase
MWTPDNLPLKRIQEKYGKNIDSKLIKKIQFSSVRFNDGGSGSFVSSNGLVLTNHHVAMTQLQKLSTKKNDFVNNGFYASKLSEEISCPDLELNILQSYENITEKVKAAISGIENDKELTKVKKAVLAKLEKESFDKTGLRSDTVELYNGGEYWIYRYKKFKEIKLVFAPEIQAASFGGDKDNFGYPRYALDFAFFRVYENGKVHKPKSFLKWNPNGPKENELIFVSGHPGSTDRLKTLAEIKEMKENSFPETLKIIRYRLNALREYARLGKENKRRALDSILSLENSLKSIEGEFAGLKDPEILKEIETKEINFKQAVKKDESLNEYKNVWDSIEATVNKLRERKKEYFYRTATGKLPYFALGIIRYHEEISKPNEERYEEYRDSNLDSWKFKIFSKAEIYKDKEEFKFIKDLDLSIQELGKDDEFIKLMLNGKSSEETGKEIIGKTKLDDAAYRKKLIESKEEYTNSKDPLLLRIKSIEPILRKKRSWYEEEIETVLSKEGAKLSTLRFKLYGKETYPDATFTLRLSFGKMKGYEIDGHAIPAFTTFHGLLERAIGFGNKNEFSLSKKIEENKKNINLSIPFNFVSTHDITGGNSGSPVINLSGELVGLIFDGNEYSHINTYNYTENKARAVSVHSAGILEALRSIYKAKSIVKELLDE